MTEDSKCVNCGQMTPHGSKWCATCGTDLVQTANPPAALAPAVAEPSPVAPPPGPDAAPPQAMLMCAQHPGAAALQRCQVCGGAVCAVCDLAIPRPGSNSSNSMLQLSSLMHLCPNCAARGRGPSVIPASPVLPLPGGVMCVRHPEVAAVRRCAMCSKAVCQTCDFELPGHFHICPDCASKPETGMSSKRKRNLIISFVLAAWSTLGLAVLLSGALADRLNSKSEVEALGVAINLLIFAPAIAGMALGFAGYDRKLSNPPAIWVAAGWNGLIVIGLLLLTVLGIANG